MNDEQGKFLKLLDEEVVNDLHNKGKQYIDRFSNIKMRYKKFSLNVSAAYLFGLFYICFYEEQILHIDKYNLIAFATLFTVITVKLIQFLDINIGHNQLRNIFKYLLLYEKMQTALIKPYTKVEKLLYGRRFDPVLLDFLFYLSINLSISVLGVLALVLKMNSAFFPNLIISVVFISIFILWQVLTLIFLVHDRHKTID